MGAVGLAKDSPMQAQCPLVGELPQFKQGPSSVWGGSHLEGDPSLQKGWMARDLPWAPPLGNAQADHLSAQSHRLDNGQQEGLAANPQTKFLPSDARNTAPTATWPLLIRGPLHPSRAGRQQEKEPVWVAQSSVIDQGSLYLCGQGL